LLSKPQNRAISAVKIPLHLSKRPLSKSSLEAYANLMTSKVRNITNSPHLISIHILAKARHTQLSLRSKRQRRIEISPGEGQLVILIKFRAAMDDKAGLVLNTALIEHHEEISGKPLKGPMCTTKMSLSCMNVMPTNGEVNSVIGALKGH